MKIHFIGICGVAMSALAIALREQGHKITGSDAGFFPPVSDWLKKNKIVFYPGYHPDKMIENGQPNIVIVGNVASSSNPEWVYVQNNNLEYLSYPEAIAKFWVKKNSIVCGGTYGKTTTSALLAWIFDCAGYEPSYMFGGLTINDFLSAKIQTGNWSILEGDEYKSARWDNSPKFSHYSPTHLLLTSVIWDHADVYPTESSYLDAFENLVKNIPNKGLLVYCSDNENAKIIAKQAKCQKISYGRNEQNDFQYFNIAQTKDGIDFEIKHHNENFLINSPMLGEYMAENICGCFALAKTSGIETKKIIEAIKNFKGIKRRLEKRTQGKVVVYDDIAHSPQKAESVLKTLRQIYSGKIFAVFEPNTGNRQRQSAAGYDQAFKDADTMIIPRLTKLKTQKGGSKHLDGKELSEIISKTHPDVKYIEDDEKLIEYLKQEAKQGDVIVFLGSHGFRGMIEELPIHAPP